MRRITSDLSKILSGRSPRNFSKVQLSTNSTLDGRTPPAMISVTVSPATATSLTTATIVRLVCGCGSSRSVILEITPSVPSEPTNSIINSYPVRFLGVSPPSFTIVPSASTTSSPRTYCLATPYLRQEGPPEFSATTPPIVQPAKLWGSGGKNRPSSARAFWKSCKMTPGSTVALRLVRLISMMRSIRVVHRTMPPLTGMEPPLTLVPPPRGVTGILFSPANFRISEI